MGRNSEHGEALVGDLDVVVGILGSVGRGPFDGGVQESDRGCAGVAEGDGEFGRAGAFHGFGIGDRCPG